MDPLASAAVLFQPTQGAVTANFHIFADIFTAVMLPVHGAVNGVAGALSATVASWVKGFVLAAFMMWAMATLLALETGFFEKLIGKVLIPVVIVLYLLQGHYDQFVVQPATSLVTDLGNAMVGNIGGSAPTGGGPFDTLWNKAYVAAVKTYLAIPNSLMTPTGLGMALTVGLYCLVAVAAVGFAFCMFLVSQIGLYVLLSIGPLFIGFGAFQFTRFLLKGYVSALASIICTEFILLALLALAFQVENATLTPLMNNPAKASIWGMISNLLVVGIILVVFTVIAWKSAAWAVGICGGIFDGIAPWLAAASATGHAGLAVGSAVGSRAAAAMPITRPFTAAGRSLSGG